MFFLVQYFISKALSDMTALEIKFYIVTMTSFASDDDSFRINHDIQVGHYFDYWRRLSFSNRRKSGQIANIEIEKDSDDVDVDVDDDISSDKICDESFESGETENNTSSIEHVCYCQEEENVKTV
jgi:hypothetical protein